MKWLLMITISGLFVLIVSACDNGASKITDKPLFAFISLFSQTELVSGDLIDASVGATNDPLVRKTKYGLVEGRNDDSNTLSWKGIPFAKPPVGDLRWKEPKNLDSWTGIKETTEFCSTCPQYTTDPNDFSKAGPIGGSEDCLYLNIWRPNTDEKNLPVYFWIYGGGNSIQLPLHQDLPGANLASRNNFVVVSINYRVGPFGWLTYPALRDGNLSSNSGNYGTLDIIKALKWVRENIVAFGGNPDNITVAGESQGGLNVMSLIISYLAKDLFHKAVVESGAINLSTVASGEKFAEGLIVKLIIKDGKASDDASAKAYLDKMSNAQIRDYLRSKPAGEIMGVLTPTTGAMIAMPSVFPDGVVIPILGFLSLADGTYPNKVPVIMGGNKYETKLFLFSAPQFSPIAKGQGSEDLIELYLLVNKYISGMWTSSMDMAARMMQQHQDHVYVYRFNWGAGTGAGSVIPYPFDVALGACHGEEIPFFFGDADIEGGLLGRYLYTEQNRQGRLALSNAMMDYLKEFAASGSPNGPSSDLPVWNQWSNLLLLGPKGIILDADYTDLKIEMSDDEYTLAKIMLDISKEPRSKEILQALKDYSSLIY